jgi:serine/threonine protein phosphatase PrpC
LLRDVLHDAHTSVFARDFTGSASYLVAVVTCGFMTIAYEGDCCAGVVMPDGPISWLTAPHCLANWRQDREHRQLATDLGRHRISRSFKVRRKPDPEIFTKEILGGETLVFATDGFWADLSDAIQARLLDAEPVAAPCADDDVSWIVVRIPS